MIRYWFPMSAFSRCLEDFGRVIVEAMGTGVPSVVFRGGVMPELIDHGRTGLFCDKETPGASRARLRRYCEIRIWRGDLGPES